jgi:hypothetical protein
MRSPLRSFASAICFPARWIAAFGLLTPLASRASAIWEVNFVGDLYALGRDAPRPAPGKPVYYLPIVTGCVELGPAVPGDLQPSTHQMVHDLAGALFAQGYLATHEVPLPPSANSSRQKAYAGPPKLVLVFSWGAVHAEKLDGGLGGDATTSTNPAEVINKGEMIGLIAGKDFDSTVDFSSKTEDILEGIGDDRYFVMIAAYDFDAYFQRHKKVQLWVAKMSVRTAGVTMPQVMPSLIRTGGPLLGTETRGPKIVDVPAVPDGTVEMGTPVVIPPPRQ